MLSALKLTLKSSYAHDNYNLIQNITQMALGEQTEQKEILELHL